MTEIINLLVGPWPLVPPLSMALFSLFFLMLSVVSELRMRYSTSKTAIRGHQGLKRIALACSFVITVLAFAPSCLPVKTPAALNGIEPYQVGVVKLSSIDGGVCTGTLIPDGYILTAGHCLDGLGAEKRVDFVLSSGDVVESVSAVVVELVNKPPSRINSILAENYDYGVVRLSKSAPRMWVEQTLRPASRSGLHAGSGFIYGFGGGGNKAGRNPNNATSATPTVKSFVLATVEPLSNRIFSMTYGDRFSCYGDSGSPVFADSPGGRRLIGVYTSSFDVGCRLPWYTLGALPGKLGVFQKASLANLN